MSKDTKLLILFTSISFVLIIVAVFAVVQTGINNKIKNADYSKYESYYKEQNSRLEENVKEEYTYRKPEKGMSVDFLSSTILGTPDFKISGFHIYNNKDARKKFITRGKKTPRYTINEEARARTGGRTGVFNVYFWYRGNGGVDAAFVYLKNDKVVDTFVYFPKSFMDELKKVYRTVNKNNNSYKPYVENYNIDDYDDPEDFYYDNKDDFWDYDDAEDYFYSHK